MVVTLEWYEVTEAAVVGVMRHVSSMRRESFTGSKTPWEIHIEGACAEMAFAKAMGAYWSHSVNTFKTRADVGNIEVRSTKHEDGGLLVTDRDRDEDVFVLVVGEAPTYRIAGWAYGEDVKSFGERKSNYYLLGQGRLNDLADLKEATWKQRA